MTFGGAGLVFVVVLGFGGEEKGPPKPPAKSVEAPEGEATKVAAVPAEGAKSPPPAAKAPKPPAQPASAPPPDPKVALQADFEKRFATAKAAGDVGALLDAAKIAEEGGLSGEARPVYEAILGIDPERAEARSALGFTRYEGSVGEFRGKWLNAIQLARAKETEAAEAAAREEAERWTKDDFMKQAGAMREVMKSFSGEWKFRYFAGDAIAPRPYLLAGQESDVHPPEELSREVGRVLEALYARFYEEYGKPCGIKPLEVPVPVWIFMDAAAYEKAHEKNPAFAPLSSKHVGGYYRGASIGVTVGEGEEADVRASGFLYLWNSGDLEGVAIHEGTHQLIGFNGKSRAFRDGQSPWFQEGIAEFWAGYEKSYDVETKKYRFEIGRLSKRLVDERWKPARGAFQSEDPDSQFTLRGLLDFEYAEFQAAQAAAYAEKPDPKAALKVGLVYAQGWTLCHFLNHAFDKKYRPGFLQYVREELNGSGGAESFAKCFGLKSEEDWAGMEEEWKTYVLEDLRKQALALSRR
ncbi:MAG: hypothetical protein ACREIU_13145 [Planctomycetota bacterium]